MSVTQSSVICFSYENTKIVNLSMKTCLVIRQILLLLVIVMKVFVDLVSFGTSNHYFFFVEFTETIHSISTKKKDRNKYPNRVIKINHLFKSDKNSKKKSIQFYPTNNPTHRYTFYFSAYIT